MPDSTAPEPHPESLARHDPYVNRRFIEIMGSDENADITRAITVGLAINDPERPSAPPVKGDEDADTVDVQSWDGMVVRAITIPRPSAPRHPVPLGHHEGDDVVLSGVDVDGDVFRARYVNEECPEHGTHLGIVLQTNGGPGFIMRPEELPTLIAWLQSCAHKFSDGIPSEGDA
jgi:hypothetical protein